MSETVHYKGKLTPTGKTLQEIDPDAGNIYDLGYKEYVVIDGAIYKADYREIDDYDDILNASKNEDGTYDFEVKYYNGGCGFNEAIDIAIDRLTKEGDI